MDKDTRVSCTDCVNWKTLKKNQGYYFGCRNICYENCPCGKCDCYNPEGTRRFEDRPLFVLKDGWHHYESTM